MDRTMRGFIAGIVAGLALNIWSLPFYFLKLVNIHHIHWAGILICHGLPRNTGESLVCFIIQVLWDGILGVFFSYLFKNSTSGDYIYKGLLYSFFLSFVFNSIVTLYRVPILSDRYELIAFLLNEAGALIYGLILALTLRRLDQST